MQLRKFDLEAFHSEYGVSCRDMYPWPDIEETPFGATWVVVEPGGNTNPHEHDVPESFFITQGRGLMTVDEVTKEVGSGDVIYHSAGCRHTIKNLSEDEPLVFLSVYWSEELGRVSKLLDEGQLRPAPSAPEVGATSRLVISAPPTPNGRLHLGHLSGPYLGADVYRRYSHLRGCLSYHLTGSDDYQSYTVDKAQEMGLEIEQSADLYTDSIRKTFKSYDIETHYYTLPREIPRYQDFVRKVFKQLLDSGQIEIRESDTFFSQDSDRYLYEVWVMGKCPHCGADCMGNGCEVCGHPNDCVDLVDPVDTEFRKPPVKKAFKRAYFPLEPHREFLLEYYQAHPLPPRIQWLVDRLFAKELPAVPVSHLSDWGVALNDDRLPGQIASVWTEMAIVYLYTADLLSKKKQQEKNFWDDTEAEVVQFFGCDNAFYYAIMFPALMRAVHPRVRPPFSFVTNEHYQFEDSKFSTSRDHAIWAEDFVKQAPSDVIRFHLCRTRPEARQTVFTLEDFKYSWKGLLLDEVQAWLLELGERAERLDGTAPALETGPEAAEFFESLERNWRGCEHAYEAQTFSPASVVRLVMQIVQQAREWGDRSNWKLEPRHLAVELVAAQAVAVLLAPIMPNFCNRLWRELGNRGRLRDWPAGPAPVPEGQLIGLSRSFFPEPGDDCEGGSRTDCRLS